MFNFLKKSNDKANNTNANVTNSAEYERLSVRITDLNAEIKNIKATLEAVQTSLDNLRGNFNRKLSGLAKEEKNEKKTETETINNDPFVPFG